MVYKRVNVFGSEDNLVSLCSGSGSPISSSSRNPFHSKSDTSINYLLVKYNKPIHKTVCVQKEHTNERKKVYTKTRPKNNSHKKPRALDPLTIYKINLACELHVSTGCTGNYYNQEGKIVLAKPFFDKDIKYDRRFNDGEFSSIDATLNFLPPPRDRRLLQVLPSDRPFFLAHPNRCEELSSDDTSTSS